MPKGLKEDVIRDNVRLAKQFEEFLAKTSPRRSAVNATDNDVRLFIKHLAKSGDNRFDKLIGLLRYSRFIGNRAMELELLVTLDGVDVLGKLVEAAKGHLGKKDHERMFAGFETPSLGTPHKEMPAFTQEFMSRLMKGTDRETWRAILLTGVHAGPPEAYAEEKEMLRGSKDVDEYLAKRRQQLIDLLEEHFRSGTLFYTQEIDDLSLEFVRNDPEVAGGVRKGDSIYQTKVPYMMKEYLREKDPTMRRYYYCHCPLARESILTGATIPRDFCYCSAGYEKMPYEVAFGVPVKTTVLKSVLWGDDVCRFRMEIPEEYRIKAKSRNRPTRSRKKPKKKRYRKQSSRRE